MVAEPVVVVVVVVVFAVGHRGLEDKVVLVVVVSCLVASDGPGDSCCLLYTSPSPRDGLLSRMPSSA